MRVKVVRSLHLVGCIYVTHRASVSGKVLQAMKANQPAPPTLPRSIPIATTGRYRALSAKETSVDSAQRAGKRKHAPKSRPIRYVEETDSEDDSPDALDGDGSSSGESVLSDGPAHAKRQRTTRIATRSSARTPVTEEGTSNVPYPASPALTVPPDLQPANISVDAVDDSLGGNIPHVASTSPLPATDADVALITDADIPSATDANTPPPTEAETEPSTHLETPLITDTEVTGATAENPVSATSTPRSSVIAPTVASCPPLPALPDNIDERTVPGFLLRHGKGKREVNIFRYLNEVKNPRFRQVLLRYIHLETNDKSGVGGFLPTAGRPVEIGSWTTKARPEMVQDYAKGKRTFQAFVDSAIAWWGSIQPSWRSFELGEVSREVRGGWDALYALRINGLLNVVILVYWWARVLEEQHVGDGTLADYEQFSDDVAWVLFNLSA